MHKLVDILVGAMIKRLSSGRPDGVAVLAEGLVEHLDPNDFKDLDNIEKDDHGHIRIAEVNFGEMIKSLVQARMKQFGQKITIVSKNIGYELRCADPIPFDMEYCRALGFMAAKFLFDGGSGALVSIQEGRFVPMYFKKILDPKTKRMKVRMVDTDSESYYIANRYMIRMRKEDFEDPHDLAKYAATVGLSLDEFRKQFYYLVSESHENGKITDGIALQEAQTNDESRTKNK